MDEQQPQRYIMPRRDASISTSRVPIQSPTMLLPRAVVSPVSFGRADEHPTASAHISPPPPPSTPRSVKVREVPLRVDAFQTTQYTPSRRWSAALPPPLPDSVERSRNRHIHPGGRVMASAPIMMAPSPAGGSLRRQPPPPPQYILPSRNDFRTTGQDGFKTHHAPHHAPPPPYYQPQPHHAPPPPHNPNQNYTNNYYYCPPPPDAPSRPDFASLSNIELIETTRRLRDKIEILRDKFPRWNIKLPPDSVSIDFLYDTYSRYVSQIRAHSNATQYKICLIVCVVFVEFAVTKFLNFDISGYAVNQISHMYRYEDILVDIGEKYAQSGNGEPYSPEVRLLTSMVLQAIVFVVAKGIADWTGNSSVSNVIHETFDGILDSAGGDDSPTVDADGIPFAPGAESELADADLRAGIADASASRAESRVPSTKRTSSLDIGNLLGSVLSSGVLGGGGGGGGDMIKNIIGAFVSSPTTSARVPTTTPIQVPIKRSPTRSPPTF